MMWIRAFAVLFELRARIIANFNSRTLETIKSARESQNPFSARSGYFSPKESNRNSAYPRKNDHSRKNSKY